MSSKNDSMVYDERFGWIEIPEDGDMLKALGIDVYESDGSIMYRQRGSNGILRGTGFVIPKRRDTIEALRECLDDAEKRMDQGCEKRCRDKE
jgi:hypothetical protein